MRTLVLGGTVFLSAAVAAAAREAGHHVVCLARGVSGPVPDGVELVSADRDDPAAYRQLTGDFDAVVDVSNTPARVRAALGALSGRVGHWTYVSTCNVYRDNATPGQGVDAPLQRPTEDEGADPESYGGRNVACEQAVTAALGAERAFLCRPGLIAGPGDPSLRFGYWPLRLATGGRAGLTRRREAALLAEWDARR